MRGEGEWRPPPRFVHASPVPGEVARYLERLPEGLESYPRHLVKSSLLRGMLAECPSGGDLELLPPALAQIVAEPPPPSAWIPEVCFVAAHFAMQDLHAIDADDMLERTYRANAKLTGSRMYRALARVASPGLLLRGAATSWGLIHRGVSLRVSARDGEAELTLRHPPHLYPELAHRSAALGFRAVVEAANGKGVTAEVSSSGPESASVRVRWR